MNAASWVSDLLAWSLQTAVVAGLALALPALFRLDPPGLRLRYWQGVLLAVLFLPILGAFGGRPVGTSFFLYAIEVGGEEGAAPPSIGGGPLSPSAALLGVLALVAAFRLVRLGLGLRTLNAWKRRAEEAALPAELAREFAALAPRARFLTSERVSGPVTFGWREPVILLPPAFRELPEEARRAVLRHEILHVRQKDWIVSLLEAGIGAVLWFHPAIHLLLARIDLAREQAVDDRVVRTIRSRRPYLQALLAFASPSRPAAAAGLPFLNRGHLRARVAQLTQEVSMSRRRAVLSTAAFAVLLLAMAVLASATFPLGAATVPGPAVALAADPGQPETPNESYTGPKKLSGADPVYPETARQANAKGIVLVGIDITEEGKVGKARITKSSDRKDFDQATLDAVETWTFQPLTRHGKPMATTLTITVKFEP